MSKIGRNDECPCGSGKKYKKCCLSRSIVIPQKHTNNSNKSERILVKTLTDEFYQPMRLYYIVHNKEQLERCFQSLKCFKHDEKLNDWAVEYTNEAANIGLKIKPKNVPKEAQPLIIATIYIENEMTMLMDVRSIERATKFIEFIDKYVPKSIAEITHAAIYNELVTVSSDKAKEEINDVDFDELFKQQNVFVVDPEKLVRDKEEIAKKHQNNDEKLNAIIQKTQEDSRKPLPKVEKFPVHFYEDGIHQFSMTCQMRQMIAIRHYQGDINYSFHDLIQDFFNDNQDKFQIEGGWVKKLENVMADA